MGSDWLLSGYDFFVKTGHVENCAIKVVKFALDLDVIKAEVVSLSKKLFLVVLIASTGSFRFIEHDLK